MNKEEGEKYISRGEHVAARMLGGKMMIIVDSGFHPVQPQRETASAIWQAADGATGLREIVERSIVARFDADPEAAYRDAELVEALAQHGIPKITNEAEGIECRKGRVQGG